MADDLTAGMCLGFWDVFPQVASSALTRGDLALLG